MNIFKKIYLGFKTRKQKKIKLAAEERKKNIVSKSRAADEKVQFNYMVNGGGDKMKRKDKVRTDDEILATFVNIDNPTDEQIFKAAKDYYSPLSDKQIASWEKALQNGDINLETLIMETDGAEELRAAAMDKSLSPEQHELAIANLIEALGAVDDAGLIEQIFKGNSD